MNEMTFEETPEIRRKNTISEAWTNLVRNPQQFISHWNYKGAIFSGVLRAPIFLFTYLAGKESMRLAVGAALAQFIFRFLFAGISGALIQTFRRVEPAWKALGSILLVVPAISHIFEFIVQYSFARATATNDHTDDAIIRSICVSLISALFTLFIMRRNVMIVGEGSKSFFNDLKRMPKMIVRFIMFVPNEIALMIKRREWLFAIGGVIGFGIFSQILCWAVFNRPFWTYGGGREMFLVKYWGVDGIILLIVFTIVSLAFLIRKDSKIKY
jgi:hypothetical protein